MNSPYGGGTPSLRNWGVVYTVTLTVNNHSSATRTLGLAATGVQGDVNLAYRPPGGARWLSAVVNPTTTLTWATVVAPPGTSTSTATFAVSGPSLPGLLHKLRTLA